MKIRIGRTEIIISEPSTAVARQVTPLNSYVVLSIREKGKKNVSEILLASRFYRSSLVTMADFYKAQAIDANVDLYNLPHGGFDDKPETTMPLFKIAALQIHEHLSAGKRVLVNCNHGRSRSGTVIALYLRDYLKIDVEKAIEVANKALEMRGFSSGIDINGGHYGTYAQWLRNDVVPDEGKENSSESRKRDSDQLIETPRTKESFFNTRIRRCKIKEADTAVPILSTLENQQETKSESSKNTPVAEASSIPEGFFAERMTRSKLKAAKESEVILALLKCNSFGLC